MASLKDLLVTGPARIVGKVFSTGGFSGPGSELTSLNGSNISSGTVPYARLPVGTGASQVAQGSHTHNYAGSSSAGGDATRALKIKDDNSSNDITFSYNKAGLDSTSWFAAWSGYELRAISPAKVLSTIGAAAANHTHNTVDLVGRVNAANAININPLTYKGAKFSYHISDSTARTNDTTNSPSFDSAVLNFPWDWGAYNGQIALTNNDSTPRMQIRSASHTDNGESANPRYTPNYGAWREVVTATKATQVGSSSVPIYINNKGQATTCSSILPLSGGTLTGALNFANNTWNLIGDDAYLGDCNQAGKIGIKGKNGNTGIYFTPYSGSTAQSISIDGAGQMDITGSLNVAGTIKQNGTAVSLSGHTHTLSSLGAATSGHSHTLKIGNKSLSVNTSEQTWTLHDILYSTSIGTATTWNNATPGVYGVASGSAFTGEGNPESANGGLEPYRYGQLLVSRAGAFGVAQFYISHTDSGSSNRGIKYRSGWDSTYNAKWDTLLDSTNYTNYTVTKTGSGASGTWGIGISGNAATATKLATARTISLTGSVTGSGSFDGSGNLSITTTTNHTHNYAGSSSAGGKANSAEKADYLSTYAIDGNNSLEAVKASFDTIPKSVGTAMRLQHGSHSMAFGWFLNGYAKANAYGGWFISDYGTPTWVGVDNGNWTSGTFLHSGNYNNYITPANIGAATSSHTHNYRSNAQPTSGAYFQGTPLIGSDGVMEIGKYIDFHTSNTATSDFDARITASTTGLTLSGITSGTFNGSLTGNVTGNVSGSSSSCTGNAATASKLGTATVGSANRPIYLNSGTATATTWYPNYCGINSGNTANYPWHRVATTNMGTGSWVDKECILIIDHRYNNGNHGALRITARCDNATTSPRGACSVAAKWIYREGFAVGDVLICKKGLAGESNQIDVYVKVGTYARAIAHLLEGANNGWTLVHSNEVSDTTTSDKKGSTEVWASISNSSGATAYDTVQAATDASVISWNALKDKPSSFTPASHTHSYLPLSGGTLTGDLIIPNNKAVIQTMNDSSNYTTAIKWNTTTGYTKTYLPQIGFHNTGQTICILPYETDTNPWSRAVGLSIGASDIKFNGTDISLSGHTHDYAATNHKHTSLGDSITTVLSVDTTKSSVAEGSDTTASGDCSHAEGFATEASGRYSHAEGWYTTASGIASHAEGFATEASGDYSHAEGSRTTASGSYSHASGQSTSATGENQTVIGKWNATNDNKAFIIGNGTSDDARSNALTVGWDGNVFPAGSIAKAGVSTNWNKGRDNALVKTTSLAGYSPFASIKTNNGSWDIGAYDHANYQDDLVFTYITDTNYANNNTTTAQIKFQENGNITANSFNGYTWDIDTANNSDTWIPVFKNNIIQHAVLGSLARKSSVSNSFVAVAGSTQYASAVNANSNVQIDVSLQSSSGYILTSIVAIRITGTGSGSMISRGFDADGFTTGGSNTVKTYWRNIGSSSIAANNLTVTVQGMTTKTTLT